MKFSNLKQAFIFLGIENEFFGRCKNKELKLSEFCKWHRLNWYTKEGMFKILEKELYENNIYYNLFKSA